MKVKEEIQKLLEKYGVKLSVQETKIKMAAEATLEDGSKIATPADAWAVGVEAYMVAEDGTTTPCGAGTYKTDDGKTIVVDDAGKVAEIVEASAQSDEMNAVVEDLAKQLSEQTATLAAVIKERDELKTSLSAITTERDNKAKEAGELKVKLSQLEKKAAAPSVTDPAAVKTEMKKEEKPTALDLALAKARESATN